MKKRYHREEERKSRDERKGENEKKLSKGLMKSRYFQTLLKQRK